jgi:replicative DNA helicase
MRNIARVADEIAFKVREEPDAFAALEFAEQRIFNLPGDIRTGQVGDAAQAVKELVGKAEKIRNTPDGCVGLSTGLSLLDSRWSGLVEPRLHILAARPGMGKTALMLAFVKAQAQAGIPTLVFSLEMTKKQLVRRLICDVGSVDGSYMFQNKLTKGTDREIWGNIHEASSTISEMPILWDDSARMSIDKIYSRAKKAKAVNGIKWVIVDYLQLIHGWNVAGQESKAAITSEFKNMSKELELPVFVLSQLNRNIEGRVNKAPQMSDLRDAGSIEQDCDIAIFPDVPLKSLDGTSYDQYELANLYLVKTRRGRTGVIKDMRWQGHFYRYSD